MSCPFKAAVKNEIDSIKNKSHCPGKCLEDKKCHESTKENKCEVKVTVTNGTPSSRDASPSHKFGRDLSPANKHRKESGLSLSSQASSDELDEGERKLGLVGLIESVGTLLLPSVSIHVASIYTRLITLVFIGLTTR